MKLFDKKVLRQLMAQGKLKDVKDISEILKEQFGEILEEMLEAELDDELGYTQNMTIKIKKLQIVEMVKEKRILEQIMEN